MFKKKSNFVPITRFLVTVVDQEECGLLLGMLELLGMEKIGNSFPADDACWEERRSVEVYRCAYACVALDSKMRRFHGTLRCTFTDFYRSQGFALHSLREALGKEMLGEIN